MADLVGGGGGLNASSGGNGLPAPRRPAAANAPSPTSSPSGIRGPRMIMKERAAREARQRAEAEKAEMERVRAEQEARVQEEAQQRAAERRAAGVAQAQASNPGSQQYIDPQRRPQVVDPNQPRMGVPNTSQDPTHQRTNSARFSTNQQVPTQIQYPQQPQQSQQPQQPPPQPQFQAQPQQPQQQPVQAQPEAPPQTAGTTSSKPRNSFPHAFERWETLSAHWEGLTSYWIRKLEQNKDELNRDPVSQQLARQVTDLSAAGANLFHAVVELQRLRASSERKFQRWFFETRAELERAQEVNSMLENALDQERRNRDEAIREAVEKDQGSSMAQKQLAEMRKELAISKDEARRAWEELGRREQVERERTNSLQTGQPTIVGGVQVVPMTAGAPGRQPTMRDPGSYQGVYHAEQSHTPTGQPSPGPNAANEDYYREQLPSQQSHQHGHARHGSEGAYSEGEFVTDVQGRLVLDVHGNRIPVAAAGSSCSASDGELEEYDTPATTNPPSGSYDPPTTSAPGSSQWTGAYSEPQDYSGQGYGTPNWDTAAPRHHHPTRLSDVMEEDDERSRTSAPSQLSRG